MKRLLYYYPTSGGLASYAQKILRIYEEVKGVEVVSRAWSDNSDADAILKDITAKSPELVHFEVGSNQLAFYRASRKLLLTNPEIQQIVTIHDPAILVAHSSGWLLPPGRTLGLMAQKIARLAYEKLWSSRQVRSWVRSKRIRFITLRPQALLGATYMPHPTFLTHVQAHPGSSREVLKCAFFGYWDESKGIETLLDAWQLGIGESRAQLAIYGDSFLEGDAFASRMKARVAGLPGVMLGGVPERSEDLTTAMRQVDVVVLPYHTNNPAGVSGIAMRAAEVGVPIIASRVPQLHDLLGADVEYYSPDNSPLALNRAIRQLLGAYEKSAKRAQRLQKTIYTQHSNAAIRAILQGVVRS